MVFLSYLLYGRDQDTYSGVIGQYRLNLLSIYFYLYIYKHCQRRPSDRRELTER